MTNCSPSPAKITVTIHAKNAFKAWSWQCAEMPQTDDIFKPLRRTFEQKKQTVVNAMEKCAKIKVDWTNVKEAISAAGYEWYDEFKNEFGHTVFGYTKKSVTVWFEVYPSTNTLFFSHIYSSNTGKTSKSYKRGQSEFDCLVSALCKNNGYSKEFREEAEMWSYFASDFALKKGWVNAEMKDVYFNEERFLSLYALLKKQ